MSNIDAIFNDDDFFTDMGNEKKETPKPKFTPWANGEYYGHITDVESREVSTHKGKHKAVVLNFKIVIDAVNTFNQLGDRAYTDIGYIGKDYTNLSYYLKIYHVDNEELFLEILLRLDSEAIKLSQDRLKREYDKVKRKSSG